MNIIRTVTTLFLALSMVFAGGAGGDEIDDGYFAVIHGGAGERTYETYVYKTNVGYKYVNVTSTTVRWGSPEWEKKVNARGKASTREEIARIADKHGANSFVTYDERGDAINVSDFVEGPQFSDNYLVGFSYGGASWGEYYECISAGVIVCQNREALIFMPTRSERTNALETKQIATLTLTEEQYETIEKAVDREKLFMLDPDEDWEVCDGYSTYLTLYDAEDKPLKNCGGYMTRNQYVINTKRTILENFPVEELRRIHAEQIEKLRASE